MPNFKNARTFQNVQIGKMKRSFLHSADTVDQSSLHQDLLHLLLGVLAPVVRADVLLLRVRFPLGVLRHPLVDLVDGIAGQETQQHVAAWPQHFVHVREGLSGKKTACKLIIFNLNEKLPITFL